MTTEFRATESERRSVDPTPAARPLRVLIVDTAIAFGGTLSVSRNLLKHLDPRVVDASLVSACADGFVSQGFAGNSDVRVLAPRVDYVKLGNWKQTIRRRFSWRLVSRPLELLAMAAELLANTPYLLRLINLYRELRLNVVHVNNYTMEPLWAARILRIPIVYHLHGLVAPTMDRSGRRNFRHVRAFISISRAVTESAIRAGLSPAKIHEIPNFTEFEPDTLPPPMPSDPAIGIFGRVTNWKGQKEFLRAVLQVLPRFPNLKVYIVGDASDGDPRYFDECRAIAASSPWSTQIEFTGRVTDVTSYYRKCTLVVHASIDPEPFGMVIIEAMAQARPVIASTLGAATEILHDGVEGFLVDPNDAQKLAARMCSLLSDPVLAADMGARGQSRVRDFYSPRTAAIKFQQLYLSIAQQRQRAHVPQN